MKKTMSTRPQSASNKAASHRSIYAVAGILAAVLVGVQSIGVAVAQNYSEYYTVKHPAEFEEDWRRFYESIDARTRAARGALPHHLDISFGPDAKQKLDVYMPSGKVANAPVLVFLHGGGFREGDRAHYGYIAESYARHGVITVLPSYRLTPAGFSYPAATTDAQMALQWVFRTIERHGGNPGAMVLAGHSAGAILAAELGVNRAWMSGLGIPRDSLKAVVPVSGRYDLRGEAPGRSAYVPTSELKERASPILHVVDPVPKFIIAVGTAESAYMQPSRDFSEVLRKSNVRADFVTLEGQKHQATALSVGDESSPLFTAILAVLKSKGE
jgi:acetyl esterase/lipase